MPFTKEFFAQYHRMVHLYESLTRAPSVSVVVKAYGKEYELFKVLHADDKVVTFQYFDEKKSCKVTTRLSTIPTIAWPAISLPLDAIATVAIYPSVTKGKGADYRFHPKK